MLNDITLPQEIIAEILSRLPAKSIGRFRCVSKPWRALLSQPQFIKTHHNQARELGKESLILISDSHSLFSVALSNAHYFSDEMTARARKLSFAGFPDSWTEVVASCNGLVLVVDLEDHKFLINPITQEINVVPVSPFDLDPRASFSMFGLGYDSVSDDYKIVSLSYYDTDNEHEPDCTEMFVSVYSVRNGTWKKVESSPYDHAVGHVTSGVFVDGYIHWLASRTTDYSSVITAFDLAEEKFCEVPPPRAVDRGNFVFHHLVVLGGCLCMFHSSCSHETDVWMMKKYGAEESWIKFTIVDPEGADFKPLCLLGQEQLVLVKDEDRTDEELVMYNLKEGMFINIAVHGISDNFHGGGSFVESLVSPHYSS